MGIVFHNLGDTVMSAIVAKTFDSVVKAICGVVGIIFPTWAVSWLVGWEDIDVGDSSGQLKMFGGITVVIASFAYVFGRQQAACAELAQKELEAVQIEMGKTTSKR